MWIVMALGSALFAGITSILAKIGIRNTDSNVATAIRTIMVLIFSWLMVFVAGSQGTLFHIGVKTLLFLVLSGLDTGASWLCYFRALQLGNANKVTPIDKSSTVLTMVLAIILFNEPITIIKVAGMAAIGLGTYMMIIKKQISEETPSDSKWLVYASLSAVFASLTSILGKAGIENVESNLGTSIRTIVVLIMAWVMVFITKKQGSLRNIDKKSLFFILISGIATGASWLCFFKALQEGPASVVVPIDKLSIVITVAFACFFLKEKLSCKSLAGLILIAAGTLSLLIKV